MSATANLPKASKKRKMNNESTKKKPMKHKSPSAAPRPRQTQPNTEALRNPFPRGIQNLGNTCFLNASLQALATVQGHLQIRMDIQLSTVFAQALLDLNLVNDAPLYPINLVQEVRRWMGAFPANSFQDAHEFILFLLAAVNCESLQFQCRSTVQCNTCQESSSTPEDSLGLQVAIDPNATRNVCDYIESYFSPEAVDYFCDSCLSGYPAVKQIQPLAIPNVVLVQLKRFKWNGGQLEKLNSLVDCPATINFFAQEYDLVSAICHVGSVNTGHYVAFCLRGGTWYKLNDVNVSLSNFSEVITRNTYILLYLKKSGHGGAG